jgi:hypothetical protein
MELAGTMPRVRGNYKIEFEKEAPISTFFELTEEHLPREFMSQLLAVKGDGGNRVSMTTDFNKKDYGNGFGASATLSIGCGSDDATTSAAAALCSQWSIFFAKQHFEMAEQVYRQMMAERGVQVR